jgi:hypothetical protein
MNTTPPLRVDCEEHRDRDDGLDRPPWGPRRIVYYALLGAPVILVFPYMRWIASVRGEWWMEGLVGEFLLLPLCVAPLMIGSGLGIFVLQRQQRRVSEVLGWAALGFGVPLLCVAGYHLVTVPWREAPGTWPAWVDGASRAVLCASFVLLLLTVISRRSSFTLARLGGVLILLLLAIWPWLGGYVPVIAALALLMAMGAWTRGSQRR